MGGTRPSRLLHDLLVSPEINAGNVPLLVACNKSDAPLARSPTRIRDMLEKELCVPYQPERRPLTDLRTLVQ